MTHAPGFYWVTIYNSTDPIVAEYSELSGRWYLCGVDGALDEKDVKVLSKAPLEYVP